MRLLSPILQHVVYPMLGKTRGFPSSACVVTYHGVVSDEYQGPNSFPDNTTLTVVQFRSQLKLLKNYYNVISPEHFLGWLKGLECLPPRAVLLTCDDGLLNNLSTMLPVLQEEGLRCLFFITGESVEDRASMLWYVELYLMIMNAAPGLCGTSSQGISMPAIAPDVRNRRSAWLSLLTDLSKLDRNERAVFLADARDCWGLDSRWSQPYLDSPSLEERLRILRPAEVQRLAEAGMTIGAHSLSHPILSQQSDDWAQMEIASSRQLLKDCTKQPIWALAYPFGNEGAVGSREADLAENAGYECAFMNIEGELDRSNKFSLPRVHVTSDMTLDIFEAHVSGLHEKLRSRALF